MARTLRTGSMSFSAITTELDRAMHRRDTLYSSLSVQKHELIALVPVMKTTKTRFLISECFKSSRGDTGKPAKETSLKCFPHITFMFQICFKWHVIFWRYKNYDIEFFNCINI